MNAQILPDDVLHAIFRELYGISALRCRQVCVRWQEAVDSLSDKDWKKICSNEIMYEDYEAARSKYGLSWRDAYKAINSWRRIGSYEMSTQKLCDRVQHFKVLPKGVVACLQNNRHNYYCYSDTIVYYNTETFQECGKEEFDFAFLSSYYDENEHFKVLVRRSGHLCIVVNETKELFVVGDYEYEIIPFSQYTVIGKEVYFINSKDEIIYVSKLIKKNGKPTIQTKPLEAFLENHTSYEESIVAFTKKDGNVVILSDEGNKGNIYYHENADFGWASQIYYDQGDIYIELQEHNFNWKSRAIYRWLSCCTVLSTKPVFYSHGNIYLTTRSFGKTISIHYCPFYIYGPDHLMTIFRAKPSRRISRNELITDKQAQNHESNVISQLDIIETPTSHKILVNLGKKLFVLEFTPPNQKGSKKKEKSTRKKKLQVKKKSAPTYKTAKKLASEEKKKKVKSMQAKKKGSGIPYKHPYSTRSSSK